MNIYDFNEHRHQYAVWTAARAVQRDFTTTTNIKKAIEAISIRSFAEDNEHYTAVIFDELHRQWCREVIDCLSSAGISTSYGRAAKIIAIYLKTAVILCNQGTCTKSDIIHPPVDSILLTALAAGPPALKALKTERWTMLEERGYIALAEQIRGAGLPFNWQLEKYWKPA